jgi:hypothetical protein
MNLFKQSTWALLALLCLARPAAADLDPETKTPYKLRVVLHIEDHHSLTPILQKQLERELDSLLRHSFGPLVKVEVVSWKTGQNPILKEIERRGLQQALDGWDDPQLPGKTHFLRIRYVADHYEIHSRQHDQMTGLCTGSVRRTEVADAHGLARTAAGLVVKDFGVVGTVMGLHGTDGVEVVFKGGELGASLKSWISLDDVFCLVRVVKYRERERGELVPWVLLKVIEELKDGRYHCRVYNRKPISWHDKDHALLGFRCLRMSAKDELPLRLRLVDEKTGQPLDAVALQVRRTDFQDTTKPDILVTRAGLAVSKEPYNKVAFVRVMVGNVQKAQIPVLLLDERPVVCALGPIADEQAERRAMLTDRRDRWVKNILGGLEAANVRVKHLNEMKDPPEVLLAEARKKYQALTVELATLGELYKELRGADAKLDLSEGETLLAALRRRGDDLQRYIDGLDQALQEANSEKTKALKALYQRALLLEKEADCQEALNIYDKILAESPKEAKVREDRDRLAKAWQLRGPEHKEARDFVYEVWPKLDLKGVQDNLEKARRFMQVCKKAGDKYTPLKLLRSSPAHATELKRRLEQVLRLDSEDARAERKRLENLGRSFEALIQEVVAYVGKE